MARINDEFDCARFTKLAQVYEDNVVDGSAFALRDGEAYLSVNCLNLFASAGTETQLRELRATLRSKMNVRQSHRLSIVNVGRTKKRLRAHKYEVDFRHMPEPNDATHCGVFGTEYNDEVVQDLLARCVDSVVSAYEP